MHTFRGGYAESAKKKEYSHLNVQIGLIPDPSLEGSNETMRVCKKNISHVS